MLRLFQSVPPFSKYTTNISDTSPLVCPKRKPKNSTPLAEDLSLLDPNTENLFSVRHQEIQRGRKRQKVRWLYIDKVWKIQHEIRLATALCLFLLVLILWQKCSITGLHPKVNRISALLFFSCVTVHRATAWQAVKFKEQQSLKVTLQH